MTSHHTNTNDIYMEIEPASVSSKSSAIFPQTSATNNRSKYKYTFTNTNTNRNKRINNLKKLSPSTRRKTRKFKNVSKKKPNEQDFEINRFKMTKILEFFSIFFEKDTKKDIKKQNINKLYVSVTYNNSTNSHSPVIKQYSLSGDKVYEYNKVICNYFKKENDDETTLINELLNNLAIYDEKYHTKTHKNKTKQFSEMNIEFKRLKTKLFENLKDIFTEKKITFENLNSLTKLNVDYVNLKESAQSHFTLKPYSLYSTDVESTDVEV